MSTVRLVIRRISRYRFRVLAALLCAVISVASALFIPVLLGRAIDCLTPGMTQDDVKTLTVNLVQAFGCAVISALALWVQNTQNNAVAYNVVRDLRNDAFCKVHSLPLSYLDSTSRGDILSRMIADADTFSEGLLLGFTQIYTGVLTIIGTIAVMLTVNVGITLTVVLLTPISLFSARFIAKSTHNLFVEQSCIRAEQTAFGDEMIAGQKTVRAFCREKETEGRFDEINNRLEKASRRAVFFSSLVNPSTRFINALVYAAVAVIGGYTVLRSGGAALSVGGLTCMLSYAGQYAKPFNEISGVVAEMQNALACAGRIFEFLDQPDEAADGDTEPDGLRGEFSLEHVFFSYVPKKPLIEDFNLHVRSGQKIAVVGPTGCGKTTLINLLMRFYDVTDGTILIDGHPIRTLKRHALRSQIGMVLQETWIRHGTVAENIALGKPDATREEIEQAARATHAHSFIRRLPRGYDTVLTEDGAGLSVGQKQLLCIARVMLCLPPILILDEATSSIDVRTEQKIQGAFAALTEGKTSFIVAHRLSTIQSADCILVMRDGNIVETGTHEELMRRNGFYASLQRAQFES